MELRMLKQAVMLAAVAAGLALGLAQVSTARADGPLLDPQRIGIPKLAPTAPTPAELAALSKQVNGDTSSRGWMNLGDGNWMEVTGASLTGFNGDSASAHFDFKYKKTRGVPQFQTGGSANGSFQVDSFTATSACISHLEITHVHFDSATIGVYPFSEQVNVPSWIANSSYVLGFLNSMLPAQTCVSL